MSANVETLFVVREPAWHGQGIVLEDAPTSEDAIVAAGLNWEVEGRPIFDGNWVQIPNYQANTRTTDESVLGIVSERYSIIQNSEAFAFVDGLVEEGLTYESAGSLRNGKQIWLLAKMPTEKILGDDFDPYICFTNSHDGTGAVRCCATHTRVVCQNTLNLALSTAKRSWSTKHIGDLQSKMVEAQITLGLINDYTAALREEAENLTKVRVTDSMIEAMLDNMYPIKEDDSESRKRRVATLKENFFHCIASPDIAEYRGTAYSVINAAADFADHSRPMRLTDNYEENRWGQVIVGHPFVDTFYKELKKCA